MKLKRTIVLVVAVLAVVAVTTASTTGAPAVQNRTDAQTVTQCTTITDSGRYVLTEDIEMSGERPCISIAASDVTLDGDGHTILERRAFDDSLAVGTTDDGWTNVTVTNLTVNGPLQAVRYDNVTDSRITDVDVRNGGYVAFSLNADNVTLARSTVSQPYDGSYGVRLTGSDNTVRNNTFSGVAWGIYSMTTPGLVVTENEFQDSGINLDQADHATVTDNRVDGGGYSVAASDSDNLLVKNNALNETVYIRSVNQPRTWNVTLADNSLSGEVSVNLVDFSEIEDGTIVNNTIAGPAEGIRLDRVTGTTTVERNEIDGGEIGLLVDEANGNVSVERNVFSDNYVAGIKINDLAERSVRDVCGDARVREAGNLTAHRNVFSGNGAGILSEETEVVNATHNYWGAASGPSSAADGNAPYIDPVTDALADGDGDAVSQTPGTVGLSNAHFDPWLGQRPADAGLVNATSS